MAAQVQLVMGTVLGKLPADNLYFVKARAGLEARWHGWMRTSSRPCAGSLRRACSAFSRVSLFCLGEHLAFRPTVPLEAHGHLAAFVADFGRRKAARQTAYRFD